MNNDRFKGLIWADKVKGMSVMIGGSGGIGSWLAMLIARSGFRITLIDFDTVEAHNTSGQLFSEHQIGLHKVKAVAETIRYYNDSGISISTDKIDKDWNKELDYYPIMFSGFDNMLARKTLFENYKKCYEKYKEFSYISPVFIDGRLGPENFEMYVVDSEERIKLYEETLFDDSQVPDLPCTAKQTSHIAAMLASNMVNAAINTKCERPTLFKTTYFSPLMMFQQYDK